MHRTNITSGLPPVRVKDAFELDLQDSGLVRSRTGWMQKFDKAFTESISSLVDVASNDSANCPKGVLGPMIKLFDDQIVDISQRAVEVLHQQSSRVSQTTHGRINPTPIPLAVNGARCIIRAFHFFDHDPLASLEALIELFHFVCDWTKQACEVDKVTSWVVYCSESYFRQMTLIAVVVLRLCHSQHLASRIDLRLGENTYFAIVRLLKKRSLQTGDINAQTASTLTELWHNDYCFQRPDGTHDSLYVRTRQRGVSVVPLTCD